VNNFTLSVKPYNSNSTSSTKIFFFVSQKYKNKKKKKYNFLIVVSTLQLVAKLKNIFLYSIHQSAINNHVPKL